MRQVFFRASYKDLKARPKSLVPTLDLEFEVSIFKRSPGEQVGVPDDTQSILLPSIQGFLFWTVPGDNDWLGGYAGTGFPGPLFQPQQLREDEQPMVECTVSFPLSYDLISRFEDLRAGGDAKLRTFFRIEGIASSPNVAQPFLINRLYFSDSRGSMTQQQFVVPKSRWIEDILPGLGWGVSRIVEIPMLRTGVKMQEADDLLGESERKFSLGDWAGSLTAARKTVEALEPVVKESINAAHTWKDRTAADKAADLVAKHKSWAEATMQYQGAVRSILNAGAHKPVPGATLERADAELGLMLALGLRRYVGLRMKGPE